MPITNAMVHASYEISKRVYAGNLEQQTGANILNNEFGMDRGSAKDYIHNYEHMIRGERYSRTMNEYATKYYLTKILLDNGQRQLENALESVRQHLEYQYANGYNHLENIERLYEKFLDIINDNCSKIILKLFELLE
jgi:5-methylcytosine-specific restriction protein A